MKQGTHLERAGLGDRQCHCYKSDACQSGMSVSTKIVKPVYKMGSSTQCLGQ